MFVLVFFSIFFCVPVLQADLMKLAMNGPFMRSSKSAVSYVSEGNTIRIEIQLPGFSKDDIAVFVEDGTLFVRQVEQKGTCGEKNQPNLEENYLAEVFLPTNLDIAQAQAEMKNGLLVIKITRAKMSSLSIPIRG